MYKHLKIWIPYLCFMLFLCGCTNSQDQTLRSPGDTKLQEESAESSNALREESTLEENASEVINGAEEVYICPYCNGKGLVGPELKDLNPANAEGNRTKQGGNSTTQGSVAQSSNSADSSSSSAENNGAEEISACPDCNGEGWTGVCENCGGDGWDEKIQQICITCLHTGKKQCERCKGYGTLDRNGNGVGTNTPSAQQRSTPALPSNPSRQPAASTCWTCHGDGLCNNCDGTGRYEFYSDRTGDRCITCGGTGRCAACNGQGAIR